MMLISGTHAHSDSTPCFGETLTPEQFLKRLMAEWWLKEEVEDSDGVQRGRGA